MVDERGLSMKAEDIRNVCVIGAGMIAPGVAQVFAAKNYNVYIYARRQEALPQAIEKIRAGLSTMAKNGLGLESEIEPAISRIKTTTTLSEAASGAHLVIECLSENLELKQQFFHDLDQMCPPETILATNTSVMSPTEIASKATRRERILGTHFWNPPYLIPLVEVVKGKETSEEVFETTYQCMKNAGKYPVKCLKDVPGFIANRLQHALWREAISIVENGIADAATVDAALKMGPGRRLAILGPLETADMAGLDLILSIHDYIFKYLEATSRPSPLLKEKVDKGELGFKTGQGFQAWPAEEADKTRKNLLEYLIDWTKKDLANNLY
jgi:3-hydroxybutyryl-CoA dehydrogenase